MPHPHQLHPQLPNKHHQKIILTHNPCQQKAYHAWTGQNTKHALTKLARCAHRAAAHGLARMALAAQPHMMESASQKEIRAAMARIGSVDLKIAEVFNFYDMLATNGYLVLRLQHQHPLSLQLKNVLAHNNV